MSNNKDTYTDLRVHLMTAHNLIYLIKENDQLDATNMKLVIEDIAQSVFHAYPNVFNLPEDIKDMMMRLKCR